MEDDPKKSPEPSISKLATGPFSRNLALTRLGVGAGTSMAKHSFFNVFRSVEGRAEANRQFYQQQAVLLAQELGKLKGSVMKAGQMLSLYGQYFLPEEAVDVLASLQDNTQPVAWNVLEPVLTRELGQRKLSELDIDRRALGAASLGQVHRARRRRDGLDLCLKVQYPGVAQAIDSDVRTLSSILLMTRLAPKGLDLKPVFDEVREMLHREVDYRVEREFTERFANRLADDSRFVVPRVIDEYCSDKVLATSYEVGVGVKHPSVQTLPLERRNRLAEAFVDLFLREFFEWGEVQSDPNFGNYRFRIGDAAEQDQIVLLDFGATRCFKPAFIKAYADVVKGAVTRDPSRVKAGANAIGLMHEGIPPNVLDAFVRMCELIVEPFNDHQKERTPPNLINDKGEYCWGRSDLPMRVANIAARNALTVHFRVPPREIVFLHRRLAGVFIMCSTLKAKFNARDRLLQALAEPCCSDP